MLKAQYGKQVKDLEAYYTEKVPEINDEFEFVEVVKVNGHTWHNNIKIRHKVCDNEDIVRLSNFKTNNYCSYCKGSKINHKTFLEKFKKVRDDIDEYEFLTEYERNDLHMKVKHIPCGRIMNLTPTALIHTKDKCACVYGRYTNKHTFDILYRRIKELDSNYTLISTPRETIHTTHDKVAIKHEECGNIFYMTPHSFIHGSRCTVCRPTSLNLRKSSGATIVERWIREHKMYYKKEKTFDDLRSPITNHKLRFDFYIPDLNLIIEYDGKQHFRKGTTGIFTEERYKQIHLYDKVKNDYCESHNINLLRIPYTLDSKKKIYRKLNKYLMNHVCIWFTHNY